jgi:hypothetical protein
MERVGRGGEPARDRSYMSTLELSVFVAYSLL